MKEKLKKTVGRFKNELLLYQRVLRDERTPRLARWILGAAVAYAISPIDLIPDFIPVVGQLDDMVILPFMIWLALLAVPEDIVLEHRARIKDEQDG